MAYSRKRFCVLTTGRTGSTALMHTLGKFDDIAVPSKNIVSPDEELLLQGKVEQYKQEYSQLCGIKIMTQEELIDSFFRYNAAFPFCGFKSMPERHPDYSTFVHTPGLQFIVLTRQDVASTAASFITAMKFRSWRRQGGPPTQKWTFHVEEDSKLVHSNLAYTYKSLQQLDLVPNAIRITYEELCNPEFRCAELDVYFERHIRLEDPKQPITGEQYLTNWTEFRSFVDGAYRQLEGQA